MKAVTKMVWLFALIILAAALFFVILDDDDTRSQSLQESVSGISHAANSGLPWRNFA